MHKKSSMDSVISPWLIVLACVHQIVELAYQRTKNFDKLSFLYLVTGNTKKLGMMQGISVKRGDQMSRFQNSLYLGDVESRIAVLKETGMRQSASICPRYIRTDGTMLHRRSCLPHRQDERPG